MSAAPLLKVTKRTLTQQLDAPKAHTVAELRSAAQKRGLCRKAANNWQAFFHNKRWKEQYLDLLARSKSISLRAHGLQDDMFKEKQDKMADGIAEKERSLSPKKGRRAHDNDSEDGEDDDGADEDDEYDSFHESAEEEVNKQAAVLVCRRIDRNVVKYQDLIHMSGSPFEKFVTDYLKLRKLIFSRKAGELELEDVNELMRFTFELEGMLEMCLHWVTQNDQLQFKVGLICINAVPIVYHRFKPFLQPYMGQHHANQTMV